MGRYLTLAQCVLALLFLGCTTLGTPQTQFICGRPAQCQEFMERLDKKVEAVGVRDGSSFPVPHFPYLRSNRFLSAFKNRLQNDVAREHWLQEMRELGASARRKEIRNLPDEVIFALESMGGMKLDRDGLYNRVESCSRQLMDHDRTHDEFYKTLYPVLPIPDQYSLLMRAVGLYPITSLAVTLFTARVREESRSWFHADTEDLPVEGKLMSFSPANGVFLQDTEIEEIIHRSTRNPLGVPRLDVAQQRKILVHFAPIFIQDVAAPHDRFGRVVWEGDRLRIKTDDPIVYWYFSHAFFKEEPILQLNYVIWYSERAGRRSPWIERGHLDGLTARVSLDTQGKPFMVDLTNNCGCYHLFSPFRDRVSRVVSKRFRLDPFVPQQLPQTPFGKRVGIRVNSGWHQVERLFATVSPIEAVPYELIPYDDLETLPTKAGKSESMFDPNGIAKGSKRIEPLILFPMGIPSVGSMRQRGNHPISLTGRSHFDDPYLFDKNFVFK